MNYTSHWRLAYVAAFFLHLGLWLFFSLALPHLMPAPQMGGGAMELEWEAEAEEAQAETVVLPGGSPLVGEQSETGQPAAAETAETQAEEAAPMIADSVEEAIARLKQEDVSSEDINNKQKKRQDLVIVQSGSGQQLGEPPRVITDFYPAPDVVSFRGRVSVLATIDKTGKVSKVKIAVTSGRMLVDAVAKDAVLRWTFKPALDQEGRPMECVKVISIPFNVPRRR